MGALQLQPGKDLLGDVHLSVMNGGGSLRGETRSVRRQGWRLEGAGMHVTRRMDSILPGHDGSHMRGQALRSEDRAVRIGASRQPTYLAVPGI